jgi:hypothetical protein
MKTLFSLTLFAFLIGLTILCCFALWIMATTAPSATTAASATTATNVMNVEGRDLISGAFSGNRANSGNITENSGNNQNTDCVYNNVLYVGPSGCFTGSDIGAQVNAAYAALPSTGGVIFIAPQTGGTCYSYSTPIVLNTAGKYVRLQGLGTVTATSSAMSGTCLNYTPRTATAAIMLDYVPAAATNPPTGHGLRDIGLINNQCITTGGCGSSATGIRVGNTNAGDYDSVMENVAVYGFATGYVNTNNLAVNTNWVNPMFQANALALQYASVTEKFVNGVIAGNGQIVQSTTNQTPELYFTNVNTFNNANNAKGAFDFTRSSTGPGNLHLMNVHQENSQSTAAHYISGNVNVNMVGGVIEDDNSTGIGDFMVSVCSGGQCLVRVLGTIILSPRAYTNVFLMASNARGVIQATNGSPGTLTSSMFVGGADVANTTQMITPLGTSNAAYNWTYESPQRIPLLNQVVPSQFAGVSACSGGIKTINLALIPTFTSQPAILVFDETTAGGAKLSAKSKSGFTVSCTGTTDRFDWMVVGNPN